MGSSLSADELWKGHQPLVRWILKRLIVGELLDMVLRLQSLADGAPGGIWVRVSDRDPEINTHCLVAGTKVSWKELSLNCSKILQQWFSSVTEAFSLDFRQERETYFAHWLCLVKGKDPYPWHPLDKNSSCSTWDH